MLTNFRLKLTIILIVFSLIISIIIAVFDYTKLRKTIMNAQETQISMAEDKIIDNLSTIDKIYELFDDQTSETMKDNTMKLLELYEENPDFSNWDYEMLKENFGMDVFILDHTNTIIHSSFMEDVGMSFKECCPKFSNLLDERRQGTMFTTDGMDIQARTGEVKKFSYMPTPDHKYLIELGFLLEDQDIFKQFNFLETIDELVKEYDSINSITVYNSGGTPIGVKTENFEQKSIQSPHKEIFEKVRRNVKPDELVLYENGGRMTYRYIPYSAVEKKGFSTDRVVEIAYNNHEMTGMLSEYKNQFIMQMLVILFGSVGLSFIIARLVSKPIHMAFHDSLTGLKNRHAFEEEIIRRLEQKDRSFGLMMIDLDNFKCVNDKLGHGEGDRILKIAAATIEEVIGAENFAARVGGDEFVVLVDMKDSPNVEAIANHLLQKMNERMDAQLNDEKVRTSISIGVVVATETDTFESLYKKADLALYESKEGGKNQFNIYESVF